METDNAGKVVYVDLQSSVQEDGLYQKLIKRLAANQPKEKALHRLQPINRSRLLVEIDDQETLELFKLWLSDVVKKSQELQLLLKPLGTELLLLGGQWIVPKVTDHDPCIKPQEVHTDVDTKGEVVAVAIKINGGEMGTLINAKARIEGGSVQGGNDFARAATPVFAYDTGAVHGGPGVAHVYGPYPRYFVERVFFLVSSQQLDGDRIIQHRRANGLRGAANIMVRLF